MEEKKDEHFWLIPKEDTEQIMGTIDTAERLALCEKIGAMRLSGKRVNAIAKELGLTDPVVNNLYRKFLEFSKADWLRNRGTTVAEINVNFQKEIANANYNYMKCEEEKNKAAMAVWAKLKIEFMREYLEFLNKIGYIHEGTSLEIDEFVKKDEKEPIIAIQTAFRKHLQEKMSEPNGDNRDNKPNPE